MPKTFHEKLRKEFRVTQRVPFMIDKYRKPLFPQLETKKTIFDEKFRIFFLKRDSHLSIIIIEQNASKV